jgi:hypothetical protein
MKQVRESYFQVATVWEDNSSSMTATSRYIRDVLSTTAEGSAISAKRSKASGQRPRAVIW